MFPLPDGHEEPFCSRRTVVYDFTPPRGRLCPLYVVMCWIDSQEQCLHSSWQGMFSKHKTALNIFQSGFMQSMLGTENPLPRFSNATLTGTEIIHVVH